MNHHPIYLDYNATTPIDPRVAEAMLPYLYSRFGNPSSSHAFGAEAREGVEQARRQTAVMLGCLPEEILFTSGGTESNNLALKGVAMANQERGRHLITSSIEHPAILEVCAYLEKNGFRVTYLPVDEFGRVNPVDVEKAITAETILISIMHANNEIGTVQPVEEISKIAHSHNIIMHTDAAQSIGKISVDVNKLGVDLLSVAGHKIYASKGIGALFIREGMLIQKQMHGANHERNLRAGTENVLEIVGLGKACELVTNGIDGFSEHLREMRDAFEQGILDRLPRVKINGHPVHRLPNTSSISFPDLKANLILAELTSVAASAGAACHADRVDVSHVLKAIGLNKEFAMGTIRFSVGRMTTEEEIHQAVYEISKFVGRLARV